MSDLPTNDQEIPEAIPAATTGGRAPWGLVALVAAIVAVAGGVVSYESGDGQVATIRVTKHGMLPEGIVEDPDYFVNVTTKDGKTHTTNGYDDVPIGNGLDFKLPVPVDLETIDHADLMDRDVVSHDMLDRVDVRERICRGQIYEFEFQGPASKGRNAGLAMLAGGGAIAVLAAILLVRAHAV